MALWAVLKSLVLFCKQYRVNQELKMENDVIRQQYSGVVKKTGSWTQTQAWVLIR